MNRIALFLLTLFLVQCDAEKENPNIASEKDVLPYLNYDKKSADGNLQFWEAELTENERNILAMPRVAGALSGRFRSEGRIGDLLRSDSLLRRTVQINAQPSAGLYLSLAQNAIAQHQFRRANLYLDTAFSIGDRPYGTMLLRFDVAMETGDYPLAASLLKQIQNERSKFQYLLRKAKYQDYEGDLEGALKSMEEALAWAEEKENEALILWARSNLADMYGHDGQIQKSYDTNLKVLAQDSSYKYALKGIAWVAYANDKNLELAKAIIQNLHQKNPKPDYDLLLAEMAAFEGDEKAEKEHLKLFKKEASKPEYGGMYHTYLFDIYADEKSSLPKAKAIAYQEIAERPTPASYSLLAWVYSKNGNVEKAVEIIENQVAGKTYEPNAQYKMGVIYKLDGQNDKAEKYLKEAQSAAYELGPGTAAHVEKLLSQL